jgi:transposase
MTSPLALEAVGQINALFEIARSITGQSAETRRIVRQEQSAPLVAGRVICSPALKDRRSG